MTGDASDDAERNDRLAAAAVPLLWAKLVPGGYHPLLCHLLDVAAVAEALWDRAVAPVVRSCVAADLGLSDGDARRWVAFLAGTHDAAKCSPCFSRKDAAAEARLAALGLPIDDETVPGDEPHGAIVAATLDADLVAELDLTRTVARRIAAVVGAHHGTFPRPDEQHAAKLASGGPMWRSIRREVVRRLAAAFAVDGATHLGGLSEGAAIWLAGFVSVADWIGSNRLFFPAHAVDGRDPAVDPTAYLDLARDRARRALDRLGWAMPSLGEPPDRFEDLFPGRIPNPMQRLAIDLGERLTGPCLVVIEERTGSGKTEAALWLADRWAAREGRTGAYVALPTRATSDQMFGRVRAFLGRRYRDETVNLQLLHGLAGLSAEFGELRRLADHRQAPDAAAAEHLFAPEGIDGPPGDDGASADVVAAEWFTHRKRGLLAPFGVGTIDQALLAVLQTRHYFVRLGGLAGKTVIVDEVHAYDTYMSVLLERLLRWLAALGASVVLLSATLPAARRDALLAAYREGLVPTLPGAGPRPAPRARAETERSVGYPRVSWVHRDGAGATPIPRRANDRRPPVAIEWVDAEPPADLAGPFPLGERLRVALAEGGCAAVVCNTVERAQRVYASLKRVFPSQAVFADGVGDGGPELEALHARYRFDDRQEREHRVLARFGKRDDRVVVPDGPPRPVRRPWRAILVATQVIEQSLDLDFDLLVTDLAPVDLILQRMGRLHRHDRSDRPRRLSEPRLWIGRPVERDGLPEFDAGSLWVYDPHILLRSWLALRRRTPNGGGTIAVPDDVEGLIEEVYGASSAPPTDASPALRTRWERTWVDLCARRTQDESAARSPLVLPPGYGDRIFEDRNRRLDEDNPSIHADQQARTRLAPPSVEVVCLTPDECSRLLPGGTPTEAQALELMRRAVSIGNRHVYRRLVEREVPAGWKRSALLRHHRLILLDETGGCDVGNRRIVRNEELGITIEPVAG